MHNDDMVVRSAAPAGGLVDDGEVALARLLRLTPGPGAGGNPVVARAMLVVLIGAVIALTVLALGGLL